jgi:2,3-bisphosphoglycerate-independent phosphoglycerate mutase
MSIVTYRVPRLIYLVIDGGADRPGDRKTSFEYADTPNLDEIAKRSIGGYMYVLGEGVAPESDAAVFSLLGYDPRRYYVGRGPIEVYGLGKSMIPDREIALRGNLATIDPESGKLLDRRCGRDITTEEAIELIKGIEYIDLGIHDGYAKTYVGVGYRLAVIIGSNKYELSDNVSNTDPAYLRRGKIAHSIKDFEPFPKSCKPLDTSRKSKITAELVNKYVEIVSKHLRENEINRRRIEKGLPPCNIVLLRDAGMRPSYLPLFKHLHGFKMGAVVEMPVERGIANLLALAMAEVPPPIKDKSVSYPRLVEKTELLLDMADAVYIHIKGPDEPGHDGDFEAKVKAIEDIDKYYLSLLLDKVDLKNVSILITCDHATPPTARGHTSDPVPFTLYIPLKKPDGFEAFHEKEIFEKGSIGKLEYGWHLLPIVKRMIWGTTL